MISNAKIVCPDSMTEVFSTSSGAIYQDDRARCWYIQFQGHTSRFEYRCLQKLKKAVYAIDIERMLLSVSPDTDTEIILCSCGPVYILTIRQVLAFRELLQGAFVMFELNHLVYDCLNRLAADN